MSGRRAADSAQVGPRRLRLTDDSGAGKDNLPGPLLEQGHAPHTTSKPGLTTFCRAGSSTQ
ncbi:hypothetical protein GCM10023086_74970 [Streptomyces venetus]|uniref:Uncharacterized protein n=1 Tax=Streptomyces venetus TaxID=1701086 RepID=A0ABP8HI90_9ACTN